MTTHRPRLIILGHARHGKDTVAGLLRARHHYNFVSSSWFMAERVLWPHYQSYPNNPYPTLHDCFEDRTNHRDVWYSKISEYNQGNLARLTKAIFEAGNDIYVGLRNARELHAGKIQGAYNIAIWVDASERLPPEPRSSCTVEPWMADYILDNNGTLEDLDRGLEVLYNKRIRPLERQPTGYTCPVCQGGLLMADVE